MNGETKRQFLKQKTKPEKSKLRHKSEKEDIESIELFITQNTEKLPKIPKIATTSPKPQNPKRSADSITTQTTQNIDIIEQLLKNPAPIHQKNNNDIDKEQTIRYYRHLTFKQLNNNKTKQNLKRHLEKSTIPNGLKLNIECHFQLNSTERDEWNSVLTRSSRELTKIGVRHLERTLEKIAEERKELKKKMRPETIQLTDQKIAEEFNAPRYTDQHNKRQKTDNT